MSAVAGMLYLVVFHGYATSTSTHKFLLYFYLFVYQDNSASKLMVYLMILLFRNSVQSRYFRLHEKTITML